MLPRFEQVLKLQRLRSLSLNGKITVFKYLAISKVVYLAMMTPIVKFLIDDPKIKQLFKFNKNKNGDVKEVDSFSNVTKALKIKISSKENNT